MAYRRIFNQFRTHGKNAWNNFREKGPGIWKSLQNEEAVIGCAFMYGISFNVDVYNSTSLSDMLDSPLSNGFLRIINGAFYSIGGMVVAAITPEIMMPIFPVLMGLSLIHHTIIHDANKPMRKKSDINFNAKNQK
jgi:hypothetical protein